MSWISKNYRERALNYHLRHKDSGKKTKGNRFLRAIARRSSNNMDTRIIIVGPAGIGKSYCALKLAETIDPLYIKDPAKAIKERLFFAAEDYLKAVITQPPFSALIYDEAAQSWHHREFMSPANIILSKTMIGYRFKRFITILCIPNIGMIDKDARSLAQYIVNIERQGSAEVYNIKVQKFGGEPWYPACLHRLGIALPSVKLRHQYEAKKVATQDELYATWESQMREDSKPRITNDQMIKVIKENPDKFMKGERVNVALLTGHFDIGRDRAEGIRAKFEAENPNESQQ